MGTLSRGAEEMKTPYEVIEKKEVLHECFAQLLADSSHLRQRLAIDRDDATHPLNIFRERILRIFHDIFTVQYQTEADMQKLLEQLQYARSSLQQLKEKSVKKKHSLITKIAKAFNPQKTQLNQKETHI